MILSAPELEETKPQVAYDAKRVAVIILANNEGAIIGKVIRSVLGTLEADDAVFVVADNCSDDTCDQAIRAGARVLERKSGGSDGKGAALKWIIKEEQSLSEYSLLVILDADSDIPPDFVVKVKAGHVPGTVMQCFVQPVAYVDSPLKTLMALSEILEQRVLDPVRGWLHWPVRLRGTGMVFPPAILAKVAEEVETEVEDIALSLLVVAGGGRIMQLGGVPVFDPKPDGEKLAARQRARWFRGQWKAFWRYRREIGKIFLRGPAGWSLLGALFCKPRWLFDGLLFLVGIASVFYFPVLAGLCFLILFFDVACLLVAVGQMEDKPKFLKAIVYFPSFLSMWVRGILLAFRKTPWLRTRE